jgi:peptidoglycan/LPS O-acetylase OafA/YrhL
MTPGAPRSLAAGAARSGSPDAGGARRLATGDPLRGIAVLGVMALHVATGAVYITGFLLGAGGTLRPEEAFTAAGEWVLRALPVSVYLFFALSGFLITRPFVDAFVGGTARPALAPYLRNRALRLFPAAWVALAFVYLRYGTRDATTGEVLASFTLTESYAPHPLESLIGQAWSLKVELAFYLLVPLAFVAVWWAAGRGPIARGRREGRGPVPPDGAAARGSAAARRRVVYGLAALGAVVSLVYTELAAGSVTAQRSLAWALIPFMSGLALGAALAGRDVRRSDFRRARAVALAVFAAGLAVALVAGRVGPSQPWFTNLLATLSVTCLLWAPIALEVGGGGTWRWLDNPVLAWIGARSYAIYLWHVALMSELYPLVDGIEGYRVAFLALFPLVLLASGAIAEVSWRLVERPALGLRGQWRRPDRRAPLRPEPSPATATATGGPTSR